MKFQFSVQILPREVVLDVQGRTIQQSLSEGGLKEVEKVRAGKVYILQIEAKDIVEAQSQCQKAVDGYLFNPLVETAQIQKMDSV